MRRKKTSPSVKKPSRDRRGSGSLKGRTAKHSSGAGVSTPKIDPRLRPVAGVHACAEVLRVRHRAIEQAWVKRGYEESPQLVDFAEQCENFKIPLKIVAEKNLHDLCFGHQGMACFVNERPEFDQSSLAGDGPKRVLFFDGIVDPQNLGAMIRTAWLMSVDVIFLPKDRAVGLTATVAKVACGGTEHVPLVYENNFVSVLKDLKSLGFWVYSLAERDSSSIYEADFAEKTALVVGAEEKGIRAAVLNASDSVLAIPQVESGSSYNASVALGIALSEVVRPYKIPAKS